MFTPGATMAAPAENADLVNKIAFFQNDSFTLKPAGST
jgi:hypothetical protein